MKLNHAEFTLFKIEPKTEWVFAEIFDSEGNSTLIELTSSYDPNTLIRSLKQALNFLAQHDLTEAKIFSLPTLPKMRDESKEETITIAPEMFAVFTSNP